MPVSCTNFQIENRVMNEIKSKFEYISIAFHFIKCLKSDELYRFTISICFFLKGTKMERIFTEKQIKCKGRSFCKCVLYSISITSSSSFPMTVRSYFNGHAQPVNTKIYVQLYRKSYIA